MPCSSALDRRTGRPVQARPRAAPAARPPARRETRRSPSRRDRSQINSMDRAEASRLTASAQLAPLTRVEPRLEGGPREHCERNDDRNPQEGDIPVNADERPCDGNQDGDKPGYE